MSSGIKKGEYTRSYSELGGVRLGADGCKIPRNRLAAAENVWRDYDSDSGGALESVPGFRTIAELGGRVDRLSHFSDLSTDYLIISAEGQIYRMPLGERESYEPRSIGQVEGEGASFNYLGAHYILDSEKILKIKGEGNAAELGTEAPDVYIPTTYYNGERLEQRNLLTDRAKEEYEVVEPSSYSWGSEMLSYTVTNRELATCKVDRVRDISCGGAVYIPAFATIDGKRYRVTEIDENALYLCSNITEVYIASGVEKIGSQAFYGCSSLELAVLPWTVCDIGSVAFQNCTALKEVYLGGGSLTIQFGAFKSTALQRIYYGGDSESYRKIEGIAELDGIPVTYNHEDRRVAILLPIKEEASEVLGVEENGFPTLFTKVYEKGELTGVILHTYPTEGGRDKYVINLLLKPKKQKLGYTGEGVSGFYAIGGCRVAEAFDERIFLSGNPSLPNTVLYSTPTTREEGGGLYFGEMNYFTDGVGSFEVVDMLAVRDSLAVFKSGDDGSGSIFYHTPSSTTDSYIPKLYPRCYVHSGISAVGGALSFFDDPVFLTKSGLYALTQRAINYERSVVPRSTNVNYSLLTKDLSRTSVTEWCGYLVLGAGDCIYLADSRARYKDECGVMQYEWFCLCGVGHHTADSRVYRYDSYRRGDYSIHPREGEKVKTEPMSITEEDGTVIYYTEDGGKKFTIYPTEELEGGALSQPTVYLGLGELLFFGTEDGALLMFNNDKRGTPPEHIAAAADFDAEDYRARMGRRLHPDFYSFDGHAPTYIIQTAYDNCDIPHLTKSTAKHSLVLKYRTCSMANIRCEVGTDVGSYTELTSFPGGELGFDEVSFESFSFALGDYHTVPISEKEKGWVEKQITIYSDRFASPIGIYGITYRYTIKGRIKRQ